MLIKLLGTLWHEQVAVDLVLWFRPEGRFATTNPGIKRNPCDTRIPDVGVFVAEPDTWDSAYHDPAEFEIVVEVWSRSSDEKDRHDMHWVRRAGHCGLVGHGARSEE